MLDELLKHVAILGAAGKMGSGISLLLLQEMSRLELEKTGAVGGGDYTLTLIDVNEKALYTLKRYLSVQMLKYAERNINSLRKGYANNPKLISNEEIIHAFLDGANDILRLETELAGAKNSSLVFEAIIEDIDIKTKVYNTLKSTKQRDQYYLSNTSSIPLSLLSEKCQLNNRIIGFHFYNPPAVQKLLEIIAPKDVDPELLNISQELAKRLQKKVVLSHDVAGFIGNGHFLREFLFACGQVKFLTESHQLSQPAAIYIVNKTTMDQLLRPMGIFQLMDYVGIDVCQNIAKIMNSSLKDSSLHDDLIDAMVNSKVIGGQFPDGSQKNGFFQYDKNKISGVYSLDSKQYLPLDKGNLATESASFFTNTKKLEDDLAWKNLQNDKNKAEKIQKHFQKLFQNDSEAAKLAAAFLLRSKEIAQNLVKDGVADKIEDVDTVLENGFFHLYGIGKLALPQTAATK